MSTLSQRNEHPEPIRIAVGRCALGPVAIAVTGRGVCAIELGDDETELTQTLHKRFPDAQVSQTDELADTLGTVIASIEHPDQEINLPLDIRGTAFQQRVWAALRDIPTGETRTYSDVAQCIHRPAAYRAVAGACAANQLAVAVPCHRVVRTDGGLSGYRWGVTRKRALLERESAGQ